MLTAPDRPPRRRARTIVCLAVVVAASVGCGAHRPRLAKSPLPPDTAQLLTVVPATWDDFHARLQRHVRAPDGTFQPVGAPIPVVIGKRGLGWGRGLHGDGPPPDDDGPVKVEGDLRSPAGVFRLEGIYGYAEAHEGVALPYAQSSEALRCVDDPESRSYNQLVARTAEAMDWQSAERMRRDDGLYELAIVVGHNTASPAKGAGSCIFLHVWVSGDTPVTGCTAMARDDLFTLARWLRPGASIVALPAAEYRKLAERWGLPARVP